MRLRSRRKADAVESFQSSRRQFLKHSALAVVGVVGGSALINADVFSSAAHAATPDGLAVGDYMLIGGVIDSVQDSSLSVRVADGNTFAVDVTAQGAYQVGRPSSGWRAGHEVVLELQKQQSGLLNAVGMAIQTRQYEATVTAQQDDWVVCGSSRVYVPPNELPLADDSVGWINIRSARELSLGDTVSIRSAWDPTLDAERAALIARKA
jgi:hypothetical protein